MANTLGPAYNDFGYNDHLAITSRILCIKIIDNGKKFGYSEQTLHEVVSIASFLLGVSGTQCIVALSYQAQGHNFVNQVYYPVARRPHRLGPDCNE